MLNKLLFGTALSLVSFGAVAADLPRRGTAVAPSPLFAATPIWSGFYLGALGGHGSSNFKPTVDPALVALGLTEDLNHKADGWMAGVVGGYNFQSGNWVYGVELDASWASMKGSAVNDFNITVPGVNGGAPFDLDQVQKSNINQLYLARARLGYSIGNVLAFVAGGAAAANVQSDFVVTAFGQSVFSSDSEYHFGYTVGAGLEYKIASNWNARIEYMYIGFNDKIHEGVGHSLDQQVVRGGITYRFGGSPSSVVARY
jgi:outer membrane immunogenic protein